MLPMSRLQLLLLGTCQATLDQLPITHFRLANNQGLLVYLALQKFLQSADAGDLDTAVSQVRAALTAGLR